MIQSLLRAMELLELLKEANHKYSIAELSESTGLPPSTINRILQTFCEKKFFFTKCLQNPVDRAGRKPS